jgi:hypothetical protein
LITPYASSTFKENTRIKADEKEIANHVPVDESNARSKSCLRDEIAGLIIFDLERLRNASGVTVFRVPGTFRFFERI